MAHSYSIKFTLFLLFILAPAQETEEVEAV